MQKIAAVIGARPQFIKLALLVVKLNMFFEVITVHTGQHNDSNISAMFFNELQVSKPAYNLNEGSKSHAVHTAEIMVGLEEILIREKQEFVIVNGNTNSTLADELGASKLKNERKTLCFEDISLLSDILPGPDQYIPDLYSTGNANGIIRQRSTQFLNSESDRPI